MFICKACIDDVDRDHRGLNAGVFLLRVDNRSLNLVEYLLQHRADAAGLPFAEQSLLSDLIVAEQWEETGNVVFLPQSELNFRSLKM